MSNDGPRMSPSDFPLLTLVLLVSFAGANVLNNTSHFRERVDRLSSRCPKDCTCELYMVNCSWLGLYHIPRGLPAETRSLHLEYNIIQSTMVRNLRHLQFLDLSHNDIQVLKASAFRHLGNLRVLNLSFNWIDEADSNAFNGLWALRCLDLSFNPLYRLPKRFLYPLMNLTELDMTRTRVRFNPKDFIKLTNLRKFVFQKNDLMNFPEFVYRKRSLFPKLVELRLDENSFYMMELSGLDSLESLSVSSNLIIMMDAYALRNMTRLRSINLSGNNLRSIDDNVFCSDALRKLDLSYSGFNLGLHYRTLKVFNCTPNLEELLLSRVHVSGAHRPFRYLKKLKTLNLEKSKIGDAQAVNLLSGLTRLEWLSLNENRISTLSRSVFENFASTLKVLIISSNRITTLDITSLPVQFWKTLRRIDLSDNPLACDCQLTWFLRWFYSTNVSVSKRRNYRCSAPATQINKLLKNQKYLTEKECFEEPMDWFLVVVFLLAMFASGSSTIASILHRFRWHLKYWHFKHKILHVDLPRRRNALSSDADDRYYEYDAFVSYCEHDTHWVVTELRRHLETEEEGIRLCIHDRDFQLGEDIVSNIMSSIEQSRKVLLVVSNAFAASQWCHFELARVQTRMLENDRDNLVLILLEELNDVDVPPRLKLQMEKKTKLEWTSSRIGRQLFWERLRQEVGRPPESVVNSHLPIELFRSGSH